MQIYLEKEFVTELVNLIHHVASATMPSNQNVAIVRNEDLRKMREDIDKNGKGAIREAAVVTASDIARMKQSAQIQSAQEKEAQKKMHEEQKV